MSALLISWRVRLGRECRHCGEMRRAEMKTNRRAPDGHAPLCRRCAVLEARTWASRNRERRKAYDVAYSQKHAEAKRAAAAAWALANPDRARSIRQRRRARRRAATVETFLDVEIFERDAYVCIYCGRLTDPGLPLWAPLKTVLEHRVPLARGGDHSRANCATACWECNAQKGTATDAEFLARKEAAA